jgi:hypothetical protein
MENNNIPIDEGILELQSKFSSIIENKFGKLFPQGLVFAGYIFLGLGVLMCLAVPLLGMVVILISAFICLTFSGMEINTRNKTYKDYTSFFGFIKQGKWNSYANYPYMTILRKNMVTTIHSRGNVASSTSKELVYDITLLDKTHRKKLVIKRMKDKDKTLAEAEVLAQQLGVEYANYNPQISQATRERRR